MARDPYAGAVGTGFSFYIERPWLARPIGRLLWGADPGEMYEAMEAAGQAPAGSAVLDAPCGAGVAFRALRPDQAVRYVGVDLSPAMIRRAARTARRRGLTQVELELGDMQALPFDDDSFDLVLSFNGLHCVPEPARAAAELARCAKAGARLVGSVLVRGAGARQDRALDHAERQGTGGPGGTAADLGGWLEGAGFAEVQLHRSGALAVFRARRAGDG